MSFREKREKRGLSYEDVASLLRVPALAVYNFENEHPLEGQDEAARRISSLCIRWDKEEQLNGKELCHL